ncbi:MAG TPA: type II secretion system secretin GspD [Candidatus Binatia bacterium]|nr:type II secretion system secretin GspD [Candidatus Binatia bacterium]
MSRVSRLATVLLVVGLWWWPVAGGAADEAAPAPPAEERSTTERQITMDFQDVDLPVLVKFISEITKKNFIVDEKVKGKVTIISPAKISVDEAYLVFQSVLQVKGFTTVPSGAVIKILSTKEAKTSTLRTIAPKGTVSSSDEYITRLVPLNHVDANNMVAILQPLVSPDGLLAAYAATNTLIIIDTAAQTARLVRILAELDVEGQERGVEVLRLNYAFANDIAQTLAQVLDEGTSQPGAPAPVRAPRPGVPAGAPAAAPVAGGSTPQKAFKIIPDERTNTLIVLAGPLEMRRIKELVDRLDVPLPLGTGRIHVYNLKYANAYELITVLTDLIGQGLGTGLRARGLLGSAGFRGGGLSANRNLSQGGFSNLGGFAGGAGFGGGALGGLGGGGVGGLGSLGGLGGASTSGSISGRGRAGLGAAGGFGGAPGAGGGTTITGAEGEPVRITADPSTNALIVSASPQDYETIKEVIEKLDVRRRQVYIEAILLELRLDKSRALGFDFQGATGFGSGVGIGRTNLSNNLNTALTSPGTIPGLLLAAASNQTIRLPDGSTVPAQVALLTALQTNDDVNILSAPNLLTMDNQEAEIVVGQNIPFIASTSTSETNLANTFNTVDRRDVGITLRITPQISEGGNVRLDLFEEVSAVVPSTSSQSNSLGPTTTIRSATTTVVARDNQTVVIGGLIADDIDNSRSEVPFFGRLPVLGNLFSSTSANRQKINLLIFLTPRIVRNEADQRRLSLEQRDRMKAFLEEQHFPNKRRDVLDGPTWEAEAGAKPPAAAANAPASPADQLSLRPPSPRYVLLARFGESGAPPATLATAAGMLPVILAPDSTLRDLFERGKLYRFESENYSAVFRCVDAFASADEARVVYPEGLTVSAQPRELLHWRELDEASAHNVRSWTRVN